MATLQETPQKPLSPPPASQSDDLHLSGEIQEEGIFASLVSSFKDVFFPAKLPPLELTSKPIAVADRMAVKRDPTSTAIAVVLHIVIILLIAFLIAKKVQFAAPPKANVVLTDIPIAPPIAKLNTKMGGGGGQHDIAPVTQGHLPKPADVQIVPPKAPPTIPPKLAVEPTVVLQKDLKMADNNMPNIGAPNSTLQGFSMGNGNGTGLGSGDGAGVGPGSGGNTGGGVYSVGGAVKAPAVTYQAEAEFSEEARKAKFSGDVLVSLIVDENGRPQNVRIARGVGMGLDEKALEAARLYKFRPATKDGKPVKVKITLDINFQIF